MKSLNIMTYIVEVVMLSMFCGSIYAVVMRGEPSFMFQIMGSIIGLVGVFSLIVFICCLVKAHKI